MKILKENALYLVCFLILLSSLLVGSYRFIDNDQKLRISDKEIIDKCKDDKANGYKDVEPIVENKENDLDDVKVARTYEEYCEYVLNKEPYKADFYWMFIETFVRGFDLSYQMILVFLCIVCPSIFSVSKYMKNNKKCLVGKKKKATYKFIGIEMLKSSIMLPLILVISVLICSIYTGGFGGATGWEGLYSKALLDSPALFVISYLFKTFTNSIVYVCIGLWMCRFIKNPYIGTVLSFVMLIVIVLFFEVVIDGIILGFFNLSTGILGNLVSPLHLFDKMGLAYTFVIPLILVSVFMGITYKIYSLKKN